MSVVLSNRIQAIKPSPTLSVTARAAELRAEGKDIISLSVGEPDFDTPEPIKVAAQAAMAAGETKYTPVDGTPKLKAAIIQKLERDNNLTYQPSEILVSCGAKQSLFNLLMALINPGDEVIIPAPYWVSYPDMVILAEGKPVIITATDEQHFKITPEQLSAAITERTKLLMLNSPSNPTGVAYSPKELAALAEVLAEHPHVLIVSDEIYEHIYWGKEPLANLVNVAPALKDRTIVVNGVSKAYAMTGWRIGFAAGPQALIGAMKKLQSQSTSNPCSIAQAAACEALQGDQTCLVDMTATFKQRHDAVVEQLQKIPGVRTTPADGTFYLFPNVQEAMSQLDGIENDIALAEYLLNEAGVAVVPGSAFGSPGYLRLSFATSQSVLDEALTRIAAALSR